MDYTLIIAGPETKGKQQFLDVLTAFYKDKQNICIVSFHSPKDVFEFRQSYAGEGFLLVVTLVSKEDVGEWVEVHNTSDLVFDLDATPHMAGTAVHMCEKVQTMLSAHEYSRRLWTLTDPDCSQYILTRNRNVYDCVQVQALPDDRFGVTTMTVDLSEYSSEEKLDVLASYGYEWASLHRALPDSDAMRTLAECMFEMEALQNIDEVYTTYAEAKDKVEHFRRQHSDMYAEDGNVTIKELEPKWVSYSDERELWLRPLELMFPSDFEVVRATPSFLHYGEWAFTHRFIHLSDYRLNDEFDARILNRDGNMDETTLEIAGVEHIMAGEDGKPDRINDPNYILDYALLAAMIADDESGAQYMSEEQAMALVDKVVGTDRWKL